MSNILDQIIADKREQVKADEAIRPLAIVQSIAADTPPCRDFVAAIANQSSTINVIAEVKKASPSAGLIREDFDPVAIAKIYEANGAAAISCLTDEKYFQGKAEYLTTIKSNISLPVLRKDFIIDAFQVFEAKAIGADAILLIAECLDDASFLSLFHLAGELGLGCLVESYTEDNLLRVQDLIGDTPQDRYLLGVNNRDLTRMVTELGHSIDLLKHVQSPSHYVSESGIRTHEDILQLQAAGINAVLVGEHLMKQDDSGLALKKLMNG